MSFSENIFRQYDIRGIYNKDFDDETAYLIGKAFATYCISKNEKKVIIGADNRVSSPAIKKALIKGLINSGMSVIDCETIVTPMIYYARHLFNIMPAIMITASHNPAHYNGFKLCGPNGTFMCGKEIQNILTLIKSNKFIEGSGNITIKNIKDNYINMLISKITLGNKKLKIVIDCGNGTASYFAEEIFNKLGCETIPLFCESDPNFPNHDTDTLNLENLRFLVDKVKETKANIGFAFDGDADRVAVVDENGDIIFADKILILFWKEILPKYPDKPILIDVKSSLSLIDELKKLGAENIQFCQTGHSLIKAKMKEIGAVFTGELSGHIFFGDEFYGHDDGFYVACRLLRILSNTEKNLSELLSDINIYHSTPEIQINSTDTQKYKIVEKAKDYFIDKKLDLITIDGVRAIYEYGWSLVRASNTGPKLTIRCEADNIENLNKIKEDMQKAIGTHLQ